MPASRKGPQKDSLAGVAGDRVRAIIEAAEASAAAIRAEAEAEAERVRARAENRASELRSEVRGDVEALMASVRQAVDRLRADLERLEQRLGEPTPAAEAPVAGAGDEDPDIALAEDAAVELDDLGERRAQAGGGDEAREGARLVALNMALGGASRDEVDQHLREHFQLGDRAALLDEVYALIDS